MVIGLAAVPFASAVSPMKSAVYRGTLHRNTVTLTVARSGKKVVAKVACVRGKGRAPSIHGIRVRKGRFKGTAHRGRKILWSISGRFQNSSRANATVRLTHVCNHAHGSMLLNLPVAVPKPPFKNEPGRNVSVQTDSSHSVTQTIGQGGGSISLTDAHGVSYTLTIPQNALGEDTQITMTPVASISNSPLNGTLVGGVDLKPDGLQLFEPATLAIKPTRTIPAGNGAAFVYSGSGQDFHLTLPGVDKSTDIAIPLLHFTGYGVYNAGQAAQNAANDAAASTPEGQAQQAMAAAINAWRAGEIDDQEFQDEAAKILQDYYDEAIAPEIPAAMNDDVTAIKTVRDLVSFERQAALLGIANRVSPDFDEASQTAIKIINNMISRAQTDCAENHHLAQVPRMVNLERQMELLGAPEGDLSSLFKCLSFRLDFDSTITTSGDGGSFTYEVKASVPVRADLLSNTINGSEAESYPVATGSIPANCPDTDEVDVDSGTPGTFSVLKVNLNLPSQQDAFNNPTVPVTNLTILASPGTPGGPPYETYTGTPCDGSGTQTFTQPAWLDLFSDFHQSAAAGGGYYNFSGFDAQSGSEIGRLTSVQGHGNDEEATTIILVHTPGG